MNLSQVLDRSRALVRSKGLEPALAAVQAVDELAEGLYESIDEERLIATANLELSGFGVIQPFLDDSSIEELWINRPGELRFANASGHQVVTIDLTAKQLRLLVLRMLRHSGRRLDRLTPFVDADLPDGSRLHVVIPEITREHWSVNIRKFAKKTLSLEQLVSGGSLKPQQAVQLRKAVTSSKSILISGATHSGKTTLLRALLGELSDQTRIVSCEDTFELFLEHPDWVAMRTRPASPEGDREIGLRELVRQALRMRPDRLVIGEVRGAEALDLIVALNSGIPGACTIHANSAPAAIEKLLTLPLLAGENITESFLRPTVLASLDFVVQCRQLPDGKRVVSEILELSNDRL
jgi:pilus assembly protein CpaF